jgi:hypothetical protein
MMYAGGDIYEGQWAGDTKHGPGSYFHMSKVRVRHTRTHAHTHAHARDESSAACDLMRTHAHAHELMGAHTHTPAGQALRRCVGRGHRQVWVVQ